MDRAESHAAAAAAATGPVGLRPSVGQITTTQQHSTGVGVRSVGALAFVLTSTLIIYSGPTHDCALLWSALPQNIPTIIRCSRTEIECQQNLVPDLTPIPVGESVCGKGRRWQDRTRKSGRDQFREFT